MKTVFGFFFATLIVISCGKQTSHTSSVNVDTLATTYAELLVLNERYDIGKDSLSAERYETEYGNVLRAHHLTKDEFVAKFDAVVQSPEQFRTLSDRALARIQEIRRKPHAVGSQGHL